MSTAEDSLWDHFGTETNWFHQPTDKNKQICFKVKKVWKSNLGLVNQDKFDPVNQLIPLSVIPLSSVPCITNPLLTTPTMKAVRRLVPNHFQRGPPESPTQASLPPTRNCRLDFRSPESRSNPDQSLIRFHFAF